MRLGFLEMPEDEQRVYIEQAAIRRGVSPVVLEKDFWVCWLLGVLFESEYGGSLVFKGGTSLSKVFGVIDRFSEDIDLSLSPEFLGLPPVGSSRTQADKWIKNAVAACAEVMRSQIGPALEAAVGGVLGARRDRPWIDFQSDAVTQQPVLLFYYPSNQAPGFDYLKRSVKLELGSLTDQQPTGRHPVRPWIVDALPDTFPDWRCDVVALEVERTFWEKATILHIEHHRPADKRPPDRYSRHYADLAALARNPLTERAWRDRVLCERVVQWKSRFFGGGWTRYELAKPGSFRLVPPRTCEDLGRFRRRSDNLRELCGGEFRRPPSLDRSTRPFRSIAPEARSAFPAIES